MRIYHTDLSYGCFRTVSTFTCTLNPATFIAWLGHLVGWLSLTHYTIMRGGLIRWLKNVWRVALYPPFSLRVLDLFWNPNPNPNQLHDRLNTNQLTNKAAHWYHGEHHSISCVSSCMALTALACRFLQLVLSSISSPITQFIQLDFRVKAREEELRSTCRAANRVCTCLRCIHAEIIWFPITSSECLSLGFQKFHFVRFQLN